MNSLADSPKDQAPAKTGKSRSRRERKVAEARVAGPVTVSPDTSDRPPEQVLHELQVHHIELEMQNEALREAQHALEESRDRYADLYDFSPVGYLTLTRKALIAEANLTAAALIGVARGKLVHDRFRKFIAGPALGRWDEYFTAVLRSHEKRVIALELKRGDGTLICARMESILFEREGEEPVVRITLSDITDRVRAEETLAKKSHELDELTEAYRTIADVQEAQKKTIAELSARESELEEALAEKEVLLSEIHHRVKNNLAALISLLSLEDPAGETPAVLAVKKDLQNRARSMALVHETLYQTKKFSQVDMGVYLPALASQIANSYQASGRIQVVVDTGGVMLDIGRATPCGLIVNELLTNAFKYAFPDGWCDEPGHMPCRIAVTMAHDDGRTRLSVCDNGVGIPPGIVPETTQTLGLKLVNFLARHQLRAGVGIRRNGGTEVLISF